MNALCSPASPLSLTHAYRIKSILSTASIDAQTLDSSKWTENVVRSRLHNEENKRRRLSAAAAEAEAPAPAEE